MMKALRILLGVLKLELQAEPHCKALWPRF